MTPSSENGAAESGRRLARRNYAVRASAFAYTFLVLGLHGWERGLGPWFWVALALTFLVYPHALLLRAMRSRDARQAETENIFVDAVLFGLWTAALHFPTWVAYAALSSVTLNAIIARGVLGALVSFALFSAGAALWVAVFGFQRWPFTSDLVSTLCFFGALGYTLAVGLVVGLQRRRLTSARDELRAGEARYRLITEHAADLIGMVDHDGRWLYSSPSYERVLDDADLHVGTDAFRRVHPDDADRARAAALRTAATGEDREVPLRLVDRAGRARHYQMRVHRLAAENGLRARLLLVSQDLTHLREGEAFLRLAAQALEGLSEAVVIAGADGTIQSVNSAFTAITGYQAAEVLGRPEKALRDELHSPAFHDQIYAAVERDGQWAGVVSGRRKTGGVYRTWRSVRAIRDAAGATTHYVTAFHEIAPRAGRLGEP